jgi:hypothetical protein
MMTGGPDPLQDALDLEARIKCLRALLELQRRQIERLDERLYPAGPAGVAARRLLSLKRSEAPAPVARRRGP